MTNTLETRIRLLARKYHPFRDRTCLIKTLEDKAAQARKERAIKAEIEGLTESQAHLYLNEIEKETP